MATIVSKTALKEALLDKYSNEAPTLKACAGSTQQITLEFDYNYESDDSGLEYIYANPYTLDFTDCNSQHESHMIDLNFVFKKLRGGKKVFATVGSNQTMIGTFEVSLSEDYDPTEWEKHLKTKLVSFVVDGDERLLFINKNDHVL